MPDRAVLIPEVIENINRWDGQVVTVDGWLATCAGLDCQIYGSAAEMKAAESLDVGSGEWLKAFSKGISVGSTTEFDRAAAPLQHRRVLLKARINDDCWPALCLDRADILQPISIALAN